MKPRDIPHAIAWAVAERAAKELESYPEVHKVHIAGSLRRGKPFVSDVDLVVIADTLAVKDTFGESPILDTDPNTPYQLDGIQIDLLVVPPGFEGSALLHFTGPKWSNIRLRSRAKSLGLSLSQWGLVNPDHGDVVACATEEDVYSALGMDYVEPGDRR